MQQRTSTAGHTLNLENRAALTLTGVTDVDCFSEREIVLYTAQGELTVTGRELRIRAVSLESGNMTVAGDIWGIRYGDRDRQGPLTLLGKLFR